MTVVKNLNPLTMSLLLRHLTHKVLLGSQIVWTDVTMVFARSKRTDIFLYCGIDVLCFGGNTEPITDAAEPRSLTKITTGMLLCTRSMLDCLYRS